MESSDNNNVVPYSQTSEAELQLYSLHESYRELTLKHARALNLIDELRGYHIYGEPIPQSLQKKIGPVKNLWPKGQPVELNEKLKQLLDKDAITSNSKLSIHSLGSSLDDLHLTSNSHQTSPTIAFPDTPLRRLSSAGRRLAQTRDALRLEDELDSGFFSNNKKSKCSTPKSPATSKCSSSPPRLTESPVPKFSESIVVVKPIQRVDAMPIDYGESPLDQRVDIDLKQRPSTSTGFRSRIPRFQKFSSAGASGSSSNEFLKQTRTNDRDCLIMPPDNAEACEPFSSGLPTPTDSGYPPSNCTVIPPTEELHGLDDPDLFWDKLESDGLRRATSTPALKESTRHAAEANRRSRKSRRRLARALEVAVKIADQLEANTADLLRTVEEYRQRVQKTGDN